MLILRNKINEYMLYACASSGNIPANITYRPSLRVCAFVMEWWMVFYGRGWVCVMLEIAGFGWI